MTDSSENLNKGQASTIDPYADLTVNDTKNAASTHALVIRQMKANYTSINTLTPEMFSGLVSPHTAAEGVTPDDSTKLNRLQKRKFIVSNLQSA